ncbi:hypothetical protein BX661DRAFT_80965 [Kickxella alabastrina]|uniref:uncharacterized protein n=1 Tax=Kickxella alabastrina TaxID=61397 RepID=UPI00221FE4E1|nr:uncharacterized protein BX661DRAFT_80965 [Kickxella alabastrina]KAI7832994.1 hypothetical protein BX661DRAFT_80965 [Kickxella alabastrina]
MTGSGSYNVCLEVIWSVFTYVALFKRHLWHPLNCPGFEVRRGNVDRGPVYIQSNFQTSWLICHLFFGNPFPILFVLLFCVCAFHIRCHVVFGCICSVSSLLASDSHLGSL